MKNNKSFYLFMTFTFILSIINIADSMKGKRIVEVLNRYHEIDKIVIVKAENVYEIVGNDIEKYKDALEPKNILDKKLGKEITEKLKDKIVDIEYYIGTIKLLDSAIYSLSDEPEDDFIPYTFKVNDQLYTLSVNKEYRSVNKVNRRFLSEYLE